ncbi:transcription factor Pcc1 [Ramicandelaber brevisporus]|nr:transcription factor Pcc1 [Ramicandelaber brevisporus]
MTLTLPHRLELELPFQTARHAEVAQRVLAVDRELKVDVAQREITTSDSKLVVRFACDSVRTLRVSVSSFLDFAALISDTIDTFDAASP